MSCQNSQDSQLAQNNETYYFCCYNKNSMVDYRDCQKCKENQFKPR